MHVVCLDGGGGAGPVLVNANIAHVIMGGGRVAEAARRGARDALG